MPHKFIQSAGQTGTLDKGQAIRVLAFPASVLSRIQPPPS